VNCLDYRRTLSAGGAESGSMKEHRLQCPACAELNREHTAFERELHRALAVDVPEDFAQRLLAHATMGRRRVLAAAGVAALAVGVGAYAWIGRDDPLALDCIEFVMKEEAKSIMMGSMPRGEAEAVLASTLPLSRLEGIGQVRHVGPCPFNGATAYHVVLVVPQGKVTLLVMPEAKVRRGHADHDGLHALVVALANGSVGVIGTDVAVIRSVAGALHA
jgi:hypothetical protein